MTAGSTVQLYAFLQSDAVGNVFELMVGYDGSDAATYGAGKDTNNGASKKLVLTSTQVAIEATMPASFTVLKSAVLDASGREPINARLGGRPMALSAEQRPTLMWRLGRSSASYSLCATT